MKGIKLARLIIILVVTCWLAIGVAYAVAPSPSFTAVPTSGLAPLNVQFTDTGTGGPLFWDWSFGDDSTNSTEQSPSHMYGSPGLYTVSLTETNLDGSNTASSVDLINVSAANTTRAYTNATIAPLSNYTYNGLTGYLFSGSWTGFTWTTASYWILLPFSGAWGIFWGLFIYGIVGVMLYLYTNRVWVPGILLCMFSVLFYFTLPAQIQWTSILFFFIGVSGIVYGIVKRR